MKLLWNAFIARLVYILTPTPMTVPILNDPDAPLLPGKCECGHIRSSHVDGIGKCSVSYPISVEWPDGASCACRIFIRDEDNDDDDDGDPELPSPAELERMYQR